MVIREKSQFRAQHDSLLLSAHDSTQSLSKLPSLGPPFSFGRPIFRPSVHARANECGSFAPVLFLFALHRRSRGVLHFEPIRRAPRAIHRVLTLRHDTFESHLAGVGEDGRAVAFHVLVEAQAKASFGQHTPKRGLAHFQRITPQVVAVQLNEVEGVEEYVLVSAVVTDEIERGNAVVIAGDSFAVDNARARAQTSQRLDDQREAAGEVIAGPAVEPHPLTILAGDDSESIVLDLMQPLASGRQLVGFGREARRDEAGRKSTRAGKHDVCINRQRWRRLEGPRGPASLAVRRRARYAAGGGGGGLGGLGGSMGQRIAVMASLVAA